MIRQTKKFSSRFYDKKKLYMEIVPLIILIAIISIAFYASSRLPDKVPIHWNAAGEIDNYGPKSIAIWLIPGIFLIFAIFSFILPAMDVFSENIKKFYNYYFAMKVLLGIFFLYIYIATLLPNFGYVFNMSYTILSAVIILFFFLGVITRHVKRNYFIGIRTPWTLASEKVWEKTHDIGGWLFMIMAILLLIGMFVLKPTTVYLIFMIMLVFMILFVMFYSYYLYKRLS
jgi:uncharacterized membrane protein